MSVEMSARIIAWLIAEFHLNCQISIIFVMLVNLDEGGRDRDGELGEERRG